MKTEKEEQIRRATFEIQAALFRIDHAYKTIQLLDPLGTQRVIFARASFLERLHGQAQLLPFSSKWAVQVNEMILSKRYGNCLVVTDNDFPEASLWNSVHEFIAAVINFQINDIFTYIHASASHGFNIIDIYFHEYEPLINPKTTTQDNHVCDLSGLCVYQLLGKGLADWDYKKTDCETFTDYQSPRKQKCQIQFGDIFTCTRCSQMCIHTLHISADKLVQLYESHIGKIEDSGRLT